jgi:hypothetical protein
VGLIGSAVLFAVVAAQRSTVPRSLVVWGHIAIAALFANAAPYLLFAVGESTIERAALMIASLREAKEPRSDFTLPRRTAPA